MRRSTNIGSSNRQRKKSRPSSCIKKGKSMKKIRKEPKIKNNNKNFFEVNEETEKLNKSTRRNADIYAQKDSDFDLDTLSYNFSLFLCFKDLKNFIQKRALIRSFKRWQHQFTSSVLRQIKRAQSIKAQTTNDQYNFDKNQPINYNENLPPMYTTNHLYINDDNIYPNQALPNHMHHRHKQNHSINMENTNSFEILPDVVLQGTSNPDDIAHSVISPNSSILIASTSPRNMDNELSSSLSVDEVLDFSNYENLKSPSPNKADSVDNFLQTIKEFVSSDEFNSDSLGQMANQINSKKSPETNDKVCSPQSPSPSSNKIKPKINYHNDQDDPLGSTLPTDLFTSSNSDYSLNELPSQSYYKDEYTQSPKRRDNPQKKKHQSPIKMDEELLIRAAIVDEFEHDKRKAKVKQNKSDSSLQSSPRGAKRRKIIIVREYSDNEDNDHHKNDDNMNFDYINNNDNETDIIYQYQQIQSNYPKLKKKKNSESPQKKFTFSDESFSDDYHETQENQYNNQNNNSVNNNYSDNPNSNNNVNNSKLYQDKSINYNDNITSNSNAQNVPKKKKANKPKNIDLNDKNEESSLHFSSTIEIPKVELKDIIKSSSKNDDDILNDGSSFSSDKNVSVMTMTDNKRNQNSDSEPFYGFGRNRNEIPGANSSDEIEFLIKDDNEKVNYVPTKAISNINSNNNSNKHHDDFNSNNFSYNDISYDDDDF